MHVNFSLSALSTHTIDGKIAKIFLRRNKNVFFNVLFKEFTLTRTHLVFGL